MKKAGEMKEYRRGELIPKDSFGKESDLLEDLHAAFGEEYVLSVRAKRDVGVFDTFIITKGGLVPVELKLEHEALTRFCLQDNQRRFAWLCQEKGVPYLVLKGKAKTQEWIMFNVDRRRWGEVKSVEEGKTRKKLRERLHDLYTIAYEGVWQRKKEEWQEEMRKSSKKK